VKRYSRTLIGHTGFVGESLRRQANFDGLFSRGNVEDSKDTFNELLVCSAAPAQKWWANSNPKEDFDNICNLVTSLESMQAKHAVLISTVDVFESPVGVDEDSTPDPSDQNAYGRNRRHLELEFTRMFDDSIIVRLPGLVGKGLRKNALFDLKHSNQTENLNADSTFQFYPMKNLWADLSLAMDHDLKVLHLTSEPIPLGEVAQSIFGVQLSGLPSAANYDFQTKHGKLWAKHGRYQYSADQSLAAIRGYRES
jgi:nucleoside-diphosphate-sugar epimerase